MNQHIYNDQDNQNLNAQIEQSTAKVRGFTEGGIQVAKDATVIVDPTTGQVPSFNLTPEMIRQAQAQVEEGGAVVLGANGSTQMFSNIKDMFSKEAPVGKKETYFVAGKAKVQFMLERTVFEPTAAVRLSGKSFEQRYLEQLEGYIYNKREDLEPAQLFEIIHLVGFIREGHFPIKIVSSKHRIQLPKIINTLNLFFNKNKSVVFGIAQMFNGMTQMPQQQQEETKAE